MITNINIHNVQDITISSRVLPNAETHATTIHIKGDQEQDIVLFSGEPIGIQIGDAS